jgi:hypothetical protein
MDWQLLLVGVLVLLSLAYLGRQTLRTWRGQRAGCGSCKCSVTAKTPNTAPSPNARIPLEQVQLRRR